MIITDLDLGPVSLDFEYLVCAQRVSSNKLGLYFNMEGNSKQIYIRINDTNIESIIEDISDIFVGDLGFIIIDMDGYSVFLKTEMIIGARKYEDNCISVYLNLTNGNTKTINVKVANENIQSTIEQIDDEINGGPIVP